MNVPNKNLLCAEGAHFFGALSLTFLLDKHKNGAVLSVKTDRAIPKNAIFDCMKIINQVTCRLPISVGDVIIKNVFGSNIIATKNLP